MFARVMSASLKKETIDEAAAWWAERLARYKASGLEQAFMLVDRSTGQYLSITLWESEAVERSNAASPDHQAGRAAITDKYMAGPPTRSRFEVVAVVERASASACRLRTARGGTA